VRRAVVLAAALASSTAVTALTALTALADKADKDTLADLKALVAQSAFQEAYAHLGDIPPLQRNAYWIDVAAAASGGVLGTANPDDGTTLAMIDEIDRTYPQLLKSPKYTKPRAELGLKGLAGCFAEADGYWSHYGLDNCVKLGIRFVDNSGSDRAIALGVAKLARKSASPAGAVPVFKRAVATKDPAVCKDADFRIAVTAGLGLEPEHAADAKALVIACWDGVKDDVIKAFDADAPHGFVRQNTCEILKSKGLISGLQAKQCSHP
jgi:hypothetical protein